MFKTVMVFKNRLTSSNPMEKLLKVEEVAEYLGVESRTIYAWVHTRKIPYYKIGRLVKFRQGEIDRWIENKKIEEVLLV